MSRKLVATICLSTVLIGTANTASAAAELDDVAISSGGTAAIAGRSGWPAHSEFPGPSVEDSAWLIRFAAAGLDDGVGAAEPRGDRFAVHRGFTAGIRQAGAAVVLDLDIDDDVVAPLAYDRYLADSAVRPGPGFTASLGGAAGLRFGAVSAGPFSSLTYTRSFGDGHAGPGPLGTVEESLTGALGLQGSARLETGMGTVDSRIRLSLDRDFDIDDGTAGPVAGSTRRNIYIEEIDATEFDLENAISLRIKGNVPGLFFYETRIRVRRTGIREVTARMWVKF